MVTYKIVEEIQSTLVHEVRQDGCDSKQMVVLRFGGIKPFHKPSKFTLQLAKVPLHSHLVAIMHFVVHREYSIIHIWGPFYIAKSMHNKHILTTVGGISKQVFKGSVIMNEVCLLTFIEVGVMENCNIIKRI